MIKRLYTLNYDTLYRIDEILYVGSDNHGYGGGRLRRMLQCIYTIIFLCVLRFDEVLKIQAHHLKVIDEVKDQIKLTLPFRKTHKYAGKILYDEIVTNDDNRDKAISSISWYKSMLHGSSSYAALLDLWVGDNRRLYLSPIPYWR